MPEPQIRMIMNANHQQLYEVLPDLRVWQWVAKLQEEIKPQEEPFTEREQEIIALIAKGCGSHEIAHTLFISKQTVDTHRKNIYRKGNFRCVRDVVVYYLINDLREYTGKRVLT